MYSVHIVIMLLQHIQRIEEFSKVPNCELQGLAKSAQVLCLPGNRWVVQCHKKLNTYFYLLKGAVVSVNPNEVKRSSSFGSVHRIYPGCEAVRTQSICQILLVPNARRDFLMSYGQAALEAETAEADAWLKRFLGSDMVCNLAPSQWRALLRSFEVEYLQRGQCIVCSGAEADCCFVIERGHAVVHQANKTLRHLNPGDFFGEDALVLNGRRNANVTALDDMVVHRLPKKVFADVILEHLVRKVSHRGVGITLNIGDRSILGAVPIEFLGFREQLAELDHRLNYYIVGGFEEQRTLCAFIMLQRGLRCNPVASML